MASEKDQLGDTLQKKQRVEEERFFQEREKGLLEKMRKEKAAGAADAALMRCPGEREIIAQRESDSWLGRLVFGPKR